MHLAPPNELLIAIARGNAVAFIGSGPSMASGFPSWPKLLELMLDFCATQSILVPNRSDIECLINAKNFLVAAEALHAKMGDEKWFEFLRDTFDQPGAHLTEFHRLLARIPFAAAATTNYETLIERAFKESKADETISVFTQIDSAQLGTALNSNQFFVLKAHGTIEEPQTIVLTQKDYATLIHNSVGYRTFLKALFLDRTVLFLGFGLNDPELRLLLEELREIFDGKTPIHYAVLDVSGTTATEQKNFESHYGIQILPYTPTLAHHPEVVEFLKEILAKLPKYILAHAMNAGLKPVRELLNSDSHYRLVMNTDNVFSVREKYKGAGKEKPLKFTVGFEFDTTKETDREAHQALQRVFTEGEPVTIKSPHMSKFVPPEVFLPLMPDEVTHMEITIGNVKTDESLVIRAVMEPNNGPIATLENIALKKIRGGSEKAILSNEDQELPWKVTLNVDFKENRSDTQFNFDCVGIPIKQALKIERFWDALSRGGRLTFEVEKTEKQFGSSNIEAGKIEPPSPQIMKLLEALEAIQRKTGVTFAAPKTVPRDEANYIAMVAQIVNTGSATMMAPVLNFTVQEMQEILPKFASGATMALQHYADEWVSIVFGQKVHLGPVLVSCDKLHVSSEERDRLITEISGRSPDDVISVKLTPVEGSAIGAKYVTWLPKAEADAVRNEPFVRTTSLNNLVKLLFETSVDATGSFNMDEFINLLAEAKAESANEEIIVSPLLLATDEDLARAFDLIFDDITPEQKPVFRSKLFEHGWLRNK